MKIDRKSAILLHRDHSDRPKISGRRRHHHKSIIIAWIVRPMNALHRAGFILSRALFRKMWGPSTGAADPIFPGKTGDIFSHHRLSAVSSKVSPNLFSPEKLATFFLIAVAFFISLVHSGVAHYFRHVPMLQKITAPLVGAPFCEGPCLAEHAEHA